jgi:hypothetical protein
MTEKCPRCWIGDLQPIDASYTHLVAGKLFCMPQAPAWRCDICNFQQWDEHFLRVMDVTFNGLSSSSIVESLTETSGLSANDKQPDEST